MEKITTNTSAREINASFFSLIFDSVQVLTRGIFFYLYLTVKSGSVYTDLISLIFSFFEPNKNDDDEELETSLKNIFISIKLSFFDFDYYITNRVSTRIKLLHTNDVARVR
jgi:hypothetical protein